MPPQLLQSWGYKKDWEGKGGGGRLTREVQVGTRDVVSERCIALLFYVHGKHLRSCRDGQLT